MIQMGIDRIEITKYDEIHFPNKQLLGSRVTNNSGASWAEAYMLLAKLFEKHIPDFNPEKPNPDEICELIQFLSEVLYALAERRSLAVLWPIPNWTSIRERLPIELLLPIDQLFSGFHNISTNSPYLQTTVTRDSVERFQEVIRSDLFENYAKSRSLLERLTNNENKAVKYVNEAAQALCDQYSRLLQRRNLITSLLPFTAKVVSNTLGELPGHVAEFASTVASQWENANQQLVIYELDPIVKKIVSSKMRHVPNDLIGNPS